MNLRIFQMQIRSMLNAKFVAKTLSPEFYARGQSWLLDDATPNKVFHCLQEDTI